VQRKICEPKREEVMEGLTKLFDKELHILYSAHTHTHTHYDQIIKDVMDGLYVASMRFWSGNLK